jgi:hypothetical protein
LRVDLAKRLLTFASAFEISIPRENEGGRTMKIGDTAPDSEAQTTAGRIRFPRLDRRLVGCFVSHPKDFTPVCTTELGYMAKIKARVRPQKRKDHRIIGRFDGRSRRMGEGHRGDSGSRAKLPNHRGCRFQRGKTLRDASRGYLKVTPSAQSRPTTRLCVMFTSSDQTRRSS